MPAAAAICSLIWPAMPANSGFRGHGVKAVFFRLVDFDMALQALDDGVVEFVRADFFVGIHRKATTGSYRVAIQTRIGAGRNFADVPTRPSRVQTVGTFQRNLRPLRGPWDDILS